MTHEAINRLPVLLGLLEDLGMRQTSAAHIQPHGHGQGMRVGSVVSIYLTHLLQAHDQRLVAVPDWAAQRAHTLNPLRGIALRDTAGTDDRRAPSRTLRGAARTPATLAHALTPSWRRSYRLPRTVVRLHSPRLTVQRIAGLGWLVTLALRVLPLVAYRARAPLAAEQAQVAGLHPARRPQTTARPTTERMSAAFDHLTLTTVRNGAWSSTMLRP